MWFMWLWESLWERQSLTVSVLHVSLQCSMKAQKECLQYMGTTDSLSPKLHNVFLLFWAPKEGVVTNIFFGSPCAGVVAKKIVAATL